MQGGYWLLGPKELGCKGVTETSRNIGGKTP